MKLKQDNLNCLVLAMCGIFLVHGGKKSGCYLFVQAPHVMAWCDSFTKRKGILTPLQAMSNCGKRRRKQSHSDAD